LKKKFRAADERRLTRITSLLFYLCSSAFIGGQFLCRADPPYFFGFRGTPQDLVTAGVNPCAPASPVVSQCQVQNVSHFQFFFSIGQTF